MLVAFSLLEDIDEVLFRTGVFGEDVGEAVAAFVVVVGVARGAVVDTDLTGVFAVEGVWLGAAFLGEQVSEGAPGAGFGGEFGFVVGAVLVAPGTGLRLALSGAGGLGELAGVLGVAAAGGFGAGVGQAGLGRLVGGFGARGCAKRRGRRFSQSYLCLILRRFGEGIAEGGCQLFFEEDGHFGALGEQFGAAGDEGADGLGGFVEALFGGLELLALQGEGLLLAFVSKILQFFND